MAKKIVLSCSKCASRNYTVPAKAEPSTRLELKKFCARCNEHTVHKQTI
ncbi:50S ribosomal protein L33 [Planomicrobium sp. CPCC 101110]|nr:50S ribosomal protein L33 [Planomicrobium sp. CPCC 101110]TWT23006.1 50S ribosomal protein L33 [Planomicrobium sp. CPCC 101110]